jgi:hypothetical protein
MRQRFSSGRFNIGQARSQEPTHPRHSHFIEREDYETVVSLNQEEYASRSPRRNGGQDKNELYSRNFMGGFLIDEG